MKRNIFAKNLSLELKKHNFTQRKFAPLIQYSQQGLSLLCSGRNEPNLRLLVDISNLLNISIDELVTGATYENKSTRENLGISEEAVEGLKKLCRIRLADKLLCDNKFADTLSRCITACLLNFAPMKKATLLDSEGKLISIEDFADLTFKSSAMELYNFFYKFFKENIPALHESEVEHSRRISESVYQVAKFSD